MTGFVLQGHTYIFLKEWITSCYKAEVKVISPQIIVFWHFTFTIPIYFSYDS